MLLGNIKQLRRDAMHTCVILLGTMSLQKTKLLSQPLGNIMSCVAHVNPKGQGHTYRLQVKFGICNSSYAL